MVLSRSFSLILLGFTSLLLGGCNYELLSGKGPIAEGITSTMTYTFLLMLIVVIPTVFLSIYIPYKFRKSNEKANYQSEWSHSTLIEAVVWGIPIIIIVFLAIEAYKTSFSLDPRKAIETDSDEPALKIQVVALDWKWLFIYPEEGVASINEVAIPVDKPIEFLITSDAAINSFFVPRLGGQIYAMSGMENRLNLMATEAGVYKGFSANYSGFGFSGMRFNVFASDDAQYQAWLEKARQQSRPLDNEMYAKLTEKSRDNKVEYFINTDPLRYKNIIQKYSGLLNQKPSHASHDNKHDESHDKSSSHE